MTESVVLQQSGPSGVSFWLDDLSRERLTTGNLRELIAEFNVRGVTTNPTIFAKALQNADSYATSIRSLRSGKVSAPEAVEALMCEDVQRACDEFAEIYTDTSGYDGFVSIEVSPDHADNAQATIEEAERLWRRIDRPNLLVKVPGTVAGLDAVTALISKGISVNVTLLFSLNRYRGVTNAYLTGIEHARRAGRDISRIHSVASFFVSRVDTSVDAQLRLGAGGSDDAPIGRTGVANARAAYEVFLQQFSSERAQYLLSLGARIQRPLWASTGVKDPALPDTIYVDELLAPFVVNTMPEKTLRAVCDHGEREGDSITSRFDEARAVLDSLSRFGVDYEQTVLTLEDEGVTKFRESYRELVEVVSEQLRDERA